MDYLRVMRREINIRKGTDPNTHTQIKISKERHGSDYGGWNIKSGSLNRDSIVYSFGIGNDITFDQSVIAKYNVNVYAFDPTPQVKDWLAKQQLSEKFVYRDVAISAEDGTMRFYKPANPNYISHSSVPNGNDEYVDVPALRLKTIMDELGHTHIDVLKIDIEGAEYPVIADILSSGIKIKQLLVEYHHFFERFSKTDTEDSIALLNKYNYKIFSISPNGYEYSFLLAE